MDDESDRSALPAVPLRSRVPKQARTAWREDERFAGFPAFFGLFLGYERIGETGSSWLS